MNNPARSKPSSKNSKPLKVDFHLHTAEDPIHRIRYTAKELISTAAEEGYDALAITNHHCVTFDRKLSAYARDRGVLLIPGIEVSIRRRHVLVLNPPPGKIVSDFATLSTLRRPETLIIAPHPYFPNLHSLNGHLLRNLRLFDAIEYCHFYSPRINFNQMAIDVSRRYGIPLVGNSDAHFPTQFGTTYSLVHADKTLEAIFDAIRRKRLEVVTRPLSPFQMGLLLGRFLGMKLQTERVKHQKRFANRLMSRRLHSRLPPPPLEP
jgi:predicted metal-dependent phosphoesterase TrpH